MFLSGPRRRPRAGARRARSLVGIPGWAGSLVGIPGHQGTSTGGLRTEHIPAPCPESRSSPRCATDDHETNTRADASHSSQFVGLTIRQAAHPILVEESASLKCFPRAGGSATLGPWAAPVGWVTLPTGPSCASPVCSAESVARRLISPCPGRIRCPSRLITSFRWSRVALIAPAT
jgi:hypothetical protein